MIMIGYGQWKHRVSIVIGYDIPIIACGRVN